MALGDKEDVVKHLRFTQMEKRTAAGSRENKRTFNEQHGKQHNKHRFQWN